jgi:hypothetical protein
MTVMRRVNGVETALDPAETVTWTTVTSNISGLYIDPTNGVWKRAANALNGLSWGTAAHSGTGGYDQDSNSWNTDAIMGTAPSGSGSATHAASLTDVVGSRTITVTVTVGTETSTDVFTFGQGPLSVFSKTGANGGSDVMWALQYTNHTVTGFQASGNTFPAASFCGGTVNNQDITNLTSAGLSSAGFDPGASGGWLDAEWPLGLELATQQIFRHALNSKLPKTEQLLAVAVYNTSFNNTVPRKGAALAAGWSLGSRNYAWTGEVNFDGNFFNAVDVVLNHGIGYSDNVDYADPAVVCLR